MPRQEPPKATTPDRLERELARERQEHAMNQEARTHSGDDEQRHKDARETTFSSAVRRYK
jgi:hypothetical protein